MIVVVDKNILQETEKIILFFLFKLLLYLIVQASNNKAALFGWSMNKKQVRKPVKTFKWERRALCGHISE